MKNKLMALTLIFLLAGCQSKTEQTTEPKDGTAYSAEKTTAASQQNNASLDLTQAAQSIDKSSLVKSIKILSSDKFAGRAPASAGEKLTIEYLAKAYKQLGLKPANDGSYFQAVPLISITATNQPVISFSHAERPVLQLGYLDEEVVWTRKQQLKAAIKKSPLIFVGYGINAPERNWNDYAGIDVRGKTVVMLVNDPGYATQNPDLFNGNAMTYYGRWDYKFDEAARQGAAAAIIIHDTKPAAYPWSTVSSSWSGPQFDRVRADKGANLLVVEGWITQASATKLFTKIGMDLSKLYAAAKKPGFKAIALKLKASVEINNKLSRVNSFNVAAYLPGSETADEVFIYMAHWDHLGTDPSITGDGIYNGAKDNASGTAGLLEIAKAYSKLAHKPKRSVLFLSVTAEEQGLLGSAYYAAHPLFPLAKTVGGLNIDGLNNFGRTRDVTVIGLGLSELDNYLNAEAKLQQRTLKPDAEAEKGYFYRSDHFELAKVGVPMLYPHSGYDDLTRGVAYGQAKAAEYVSKRYHSPRDEFDSSWELSGAVEDLRLYFRSGFDIANSHDWPQWREGSEFKAVRDKQRSQAAKQ